MHSHRISTTQPARRFRREALATLAAVGAALLGAPVAQAQCPAWSAEFPRTGVDGFVYDQLDLSAGGATRFVLGGQFTRVGGAPATNFAVWDGARWEGFGDGPRARTLAVAEYDDGTGPTYYAGGHGFVQRWDGVQWVDLPLQVAGGRVLALHVHDDGSGPALYIGGYFNDPALQAYGLARYDGALSSVAGGITSPATIQYVGALATHDEGAGPALYVGGRFFEVGGVAASNVARWDGAGFSALGLGVATAGNTGGNVDALVSYTPPGGAPELHLAGIFEETGGVPISSWARYAQGVYHGVGNVGQVFDLVVRRRAGASEVYASQHDRVVRYDGVQVTSFPYPASSDGLSLGAVGAGATQELFVGLVHAHFGQGQSTLGRLAGNAWVAAFPGLGVPVPILSLATFDFGAGRELVASGAGYLAYPRSFGRFDGARWLPVDTGSAWGTYPAIPLGNGRLHAHAGALHVADLARGQYEFPAARHDGAGWVGLGAGVFSFLDWSFDAMASFDAGAGSELYLGGRFDDLGATGTRDLARWDGAHWQGVAGGTSGSTGTSQVASLVTWDEGGGATLYAAGRFDVIGGVGASHIARFDGVAWSPLAAGLAQLAPGAGDEPVVHDMVVFDGPSGEQLVVTGAFDLAGGAPAASIAAWDGAAWRALGAGLTWNGGAARGVTLGVFDPDGLGERLYVGGTFDRADGLPATGLASWDGFAWSIPADVEPAYTVRDFEAADLGAGRRLYVGGSFHTVDGVVSSNIAVLVDRCGANLGSPTCTSRVNSTGRRAVQSAAGTASIAANQLTLSARYVPPAHAAFFASGTVGAQSPLGDGYLCVGGAVQRLLPIGASSSAGVFTAPYDFHAPYAASVLPGDTLMFQTFFRDPAGGPAGFNSTDALALTLAP